MNNENVDDFLMHHGIKDQKWGVRRYQYEDGSLTEEGRRHYGVGPAREFANKISSTAKRASSSISTAARKKFKPTEADLDEKIKKEEEKLRVKESVSQKKQELKTIKKKQKNSDREAELDKQLEKAYEQKRIFDKQKELQELNEYMNPPKTEKFGKKKLKDMTDQEVIDEINMRNKRKTLEEMRKNDSAIHAGGEFISKTADIATKPIRSLGKFGADIAKDSISYGANKAIKSLIDDSVAAASKERKLANRTKDEIIEDEAKKAKNIETIETQKFNDQTRDLKNQLEISRMYKEKAASDYQTQLLRSGQAGSDFAYERLKKLKEVSGGGKK